MAKGLFFYHPRLPNWLGQMLTAQVFSQHLVSLSKIIKLDIPQGAWCIGLCDMMWAAVCTMVPRLLFKNARDPINAKMYAVEFDLMGKPMLKGLVLTLGLRAWIADVVYLLKYFMFHFVLIHWAVHMAISDWLSSNFYAAGANGHLDFNLFLLVFCYPVKEWTTK